MNAAEIETATRNDLGYTVVVFDDDDGLISEKQVEHTGEQFGTGLTNPDLVAFAERSGIEGYRPGSWSEVESVFEAVVPADGMSLVEIPLP